MFQALEISRVLESLEAKSSEDLRLLRQTLVCAERLRRLDKMELGLTVTVTDSQSPTNEVDALQFFAKIPESAKRYFHGLMEALDIYQSIHGNALAVQTLATSDQSFRELKQIRDMCLEDGLRSIY